MVRANSATSSLESGSTAIGLRLSGIESGVAISMGSCMALTPREILSMRSALTNRNGFLRSFLRTVSLYVLRKIM